eukprot:1155968-Pelagomonas_calceolata.AAC.9
MRIRNQKQSPAPMYGNSCDPSAGAGCPAAASDHKFNGHQHPCMVASCHSGDLPAGAGCPAAAAQPAHAACRTLHLLRSAALRALWCPGAQTPAVARAPAARVACLGCVRLRHIVC